MKKVHGRKSIGYGYGYGKTILFGEHFVVYGMPAIVCSLGCKTEAIVKQINSHKKFELIDRRPKHPHFKPVLKRAYYSLVENVLEFAGVKNSLEIILSGDLTVFSGGIGASAACACAVARAVNDFLDLGWDDDKINQAAYCGEVGVHGNPSGIDNYAAVFGGFFSFQRNLDGGDSAIEPITIKKPIEIVLADSGVLNNTKQVLEQVKVFKKNNPYLMHSIFKKFFVVFQKAKNALCEFDLKKIGQLMNTNHALLQKMNLSCNQLDHMVKIAHSAGAYGAKLTGTGKGGLMLALTPGKDLQERVASALENAGYFVFRTMLCGS